ncbi:hypothetical protein CXB37_02470 [Pseudomonas syringae pv. syringae]|nr:hypothetical protein CXB37_02470 [Pseudomonas syringae pv. syringae]
MGASLLAKAVFQTPFGWLYQPLREQAKRRPARLHCLRSEVWMTASITPSQLSRPCQSASRPTPARHRQ